jgi:molybdenum cofactor biosynthesis protein B
MVPHDREGHGHGAHSHPASGPAAEHRARGRHARCRVVTVSDTRTLETDGSGLRAAELLAAAGHSVRDRRIVRDERDAIAAAVRDGIADPEVDAVILNGGTGLAPRDVTYETVLDLLEKPIDGFGELFRMLSYEQIGAAAMLSRAVAGVTGTTAVFALPGSSKAVELGIERLIAPELGHLIGLIRPMAPAEERAAKDAK